jgi:hypothetical protein
VARDIDRTLQPWRTAHRNFSDSLLISLLPGKSRRTKISQARRLEIAGFAPVAGMGAPMPGFRISLRLRASALASTQSGLRHFHRTTPLSPVRDLSAAPHDVMMERSNLVQETARNRCFNLRVIARLDRAIQ